ncbi:hypothetical protein SKAU_G00325570 [Synaphobranchus kaupii]|uniref:NEDD4-binding protein 2-like 1 n=1 Tax=Synaphobranchus kaupii TaxID=118154 RepID=A0A9Q1IKB8_SYNKA|nr:hypothetical protein SKAU_G00325570 [Synaphobranchus kaupii]
MDLTDLVRNKPHLVILRGLPGSGKTDLAWDIIENYGNSGEVLSTDDYFKDEDGHYYFNYSQLKWAHEWNQERAKEAMKNGVHPIIIDNPNITCSDMKPYVLMGLEYGYCIEYEITPDTFECTVDELHARAEHCGIPRWVMDRMRNTFEPDHSLYNLLNSN